MTDDTRPNFIARTGLTRRLLMLLALGFLALLLGAAAAFWLQARNETNVSRVQHTLLLDTRIREFSALNERVETGRRGYILAGQVSFRRVFEGAAAQIPGKLGELARLTADDPVQQARVARLQTLVQRQRSFQRSTIEAVTSGRRASLTRSFEQDPGVLATRAIRALTEEMSTHEQQRLTTRLAEQRNTLRIFYAALAIVALLLAFSAGTTLVVMLRYARELSASQAELQQLNTHLEEMVEERTRDLQRANEEIQRFAYIVSHDLRSPLVNVMGFTAELDAASRTIRSFLDQLAARDEALVTRDVRLAAEEDLPEALGFIRSSTEKMDRLINAILRLSRQGRRTLAPERLDMDAVVQSVIDSLHQRAADSGAQISATRLPPIETDRVAIEQVFSNLVENAIKYRKPGRTPEITIEGRRERDRLVYEIKDNGRGIDPRDHERIFDLFRRSGAQDQPGEGIGLAHVRAVVHRLGGIIEVQSELDRGATFRLSLPRTLNPRDLKDA